MERAADAIRAFFLDQVNILRQDIWEVSCRIGENPELGYQEYFALETLQRFLREHGFTVATGIAGMDTAFIASFPGKGRVRVLPF